MNLDTMTRSELRATARKAKAVQMKLHARFDDDNTKATLARRRLALWVEYAETKALAIGQRLNGRIHAACIAEDICDNIYGEMPRGMRW